MALSFFGLAIFLFLSLDIEQGSPSSAYAGAEGVEVGAYKNNDWYWIRHHIKVGMHVIVEIVAKRDPYRFRFRIEMRFIDPNIDHLIFNRFDFSPIFHRDEDTNPDELWGIHLDPSIYLMDDENKSPTSVLAKVDQPNPLVTADINAATPLENNSGSVCEISSDADLNLLKEKSANEVNKVSDKLESIAIAGSACDNKGDTQKDPEKDNNPPVRKEKSGAEPIIIPLVLKMPEFDHKALLEEWISTRSFSDKCPIQDKDKLISNLKTIPNYLCSIKSQVSYNLDRMASTIQGYLKTLVLSCLSFRSKHFVDIVGFDDIILIL